MTSLRPVLARPIVLVGAAGRAASYHLSAYRSLGKLPAIRIDPRCRRGPDSHDSLEGAQGVAWQEAILDICAPTHLHGALIREGYALGVRRFIVEKPACATTAEFQSLLGGLRGIALYAVHNCVTANAFSAAVRLMAENRLAPVSLTSQFDKDRRTESDTGRGRDENGELPHVFQLEMAHQLSIACALFEDVRVVRSLALPMRIGDQSFPGHGRGRVELASSGRIVATLSSNLESPRLRKAEISLSDGSCLTVDFARDPSLHATTLWRSDDGRSTQTLFSGRDDSMRTTLSEALDAVDSGSPTAMASINLALRVLSLIDEARAIAPPT